MNAEPDRTRAATAAPADFQHIVRMQGVQKYFGAVHALRDINLAIGRNEIVGLIGDNGAGKSTLIKVLTGVIPPSSGRIFVRDQEIDLARHSVGHAHELSIETVYQDKSLGEKQPLWRNFFVGRQITNRFGFINIREQKRIAQDILLNTIGFRGVGIGVDSTVKQLSGGERQGIAIGRAMHFNSDLIILDEPTVALAVKEVRKVLDFVRRIKASGHACIYIEHNLAHVHEVADRLLVLDRGEIVAGRATQGHDGAGIDRVFSSTCSTTGSRTHVHAAAPHRRRSPASRGCRSSSCSRCCWRCHVHRARRVPRAANLHTRCSPPPRR